MIQIIKTPPKTKWKEWLKRPAIKQAETQKLVMDIQRDVRKSGDKALFHYSELFDNVLLSDLKVDKKEIDNAKVEPELGTAIQMAAENIARFHESQAINEEIIETQKGIQCWRKALPIEKVGFYIPGGSAPLFSSILMLGIPAQIAGCVEKYICTPPRRDGSIDPTILYTARQVGIDNIFKVGGAQAIAAMAYGTESIPKVDKIFGPGNQYVTKAKELVQLEGVAIDLPAGPSELLIIADAGTPPEFVAADLLSQAEHGPDSQVVLLSDEESFLKAVGQQLQDQLESLPRKEIAKKALDNSFAILLNTKEECIEFSNAYAPEHLIISCEGEDKLAREVKQAGSVFIGPYSCESIGDYASGTNHTLPTYGLARAYSGVSLDSFLKKVTFQKVSTEGLQRIGPSVQRMAKAEGLEAHSRAVEVRLKIMNNG